MFGLILFAMILFDKTGSSFIRRSYIRQSNTRVTWTLPLILNKSYGLDSRNCLFLCSLTDNCMGLHIDFNTGTCQLFNFIALSYLQTAQRFVYHRKTNNPMYPLFGLIHYWPITQDTTDYLTNKVLQPSGSVTYASNRFNRISTSLVLSGNYFTLPNNTYFSGDFTITAWIWPDSFTNNARIIDCGNGAYSDNVIFSYSLNLTGRPFVEIYNQASGASFVSPVAVTLKSWTHLAVTLKSADLRIFINGTQVQGWSSIYAPRKVTRSSCFFGFSNFPNVSPAHILLDQIKIYNRSLSADEVANDNLASWT